MKLKKIKNLYILIIFICFSCQNEEKIKARVYKKGNEVGSFYGSFFSNKHGGLNYYIPNQKERDKIFNFQDIDSIIFNINNKNYVSEPIVDEPYSRQINNSDFSFFINKKEHKIIVDSIDNKITFLLFSAKTNMEKMKNKKEIEFTFIDE